jgi:hypothetical protein
VAGTRTKPQSEGDYHIRDENTVVFDTTLVQAFSRYSLLNADLLPLKGQVNATGPSWNQIIHIIAEEMFPNSVLDTPPDLWYPTKSQQITRGEWRWYLATKSWAFSSQYGRLYFVHADPSYIVVLLHHNAQGDECEEPILVGTFLVLFLHSNFI